MKRKLAPAIILIAMLLSICVSACVKGNVELTSDEATIPEETLEAILEKAPGDVAYYIGSSELVNPDVDYEIATKTICTEDNLSAVYLLVPQLSSKSDRDYTDINQLIYEQSVDYFAKRKISYFDADSLYLNDESIEKKWGEVSYERLSLTGYYYIAFNNDKIMSIVFEGLWYVKTAAHPSHFSLGLNIDLEAGELVDVRSMYSFNDEFIELFRDNEKAWILRSWQKEVEVSRLFGPRLLESFTTSIYSSFYFTEDKLGVILDGLPFAVGNYCTVEIPYEDIEQFKNDAGK